MMDWMYFLKVNLALVLFYLAYVVLFNRITSFTMNRFLLLLFPFVATFLPLLTFSPLTQIAQTWIPEVNTLPEFLTGTSSQNSTQEIPWLLISYLVGAFIVLIHHLSSFWQLRRFLGGKAYEIHDGWKIHSFPSRLTSFSFFNVIYVNPSDPLRSDLIVAHEGQHSRLGHSYDNLFYSFLKVIFWFNPAIYLLHKSLRCVHEYEVDAVMIKSPEATGYLDTLFYGNDILREMNLTNSLYTKSNLLNRITMMKNQNVKKARWKYFLLAPVLAGMIFMNACSEEPEQIIEQSEQTSETHEEIFPPDRMKELTSQAEYPGGFEQLSVYLSENIKYPEEAKEQKLEGKVHVQFVVSSVGKVTKAEVKKGIHPLLDEEALRVVSAMPDWTPAYKDDKAVATVFMIPIYFKMGEDN